MGAACVGDNRRPDSVALKFAKNYNRLDEKSVEDVRFPQNISNHCFKHRDSKVSIRKRIPKSSVLYNCEKLGAGCLIPKGQFSEHFAPKKVDPQSLRLDFRESDQDLSDYETKRKVKKVREPLLINNVQRIVNDTVDELLKNISSTWNSVPHCQSQTSEHRGQVNDSSIQNNSLNPLEIHNLKVSSDLSAKKLKGEVLAEIPSSETAWDQNVSLKSFSDQSSDTSDLPSGFIGSPWALWAPSSGHTNTSERVSTLKLDRFPSDSSLQESTVGLTQSKLVTPNEGCLGVKGTGAEKVRKKQLVLTNEKTITKLSGDAKRSFGESIRFENEHVIKILTPMAASISQSLGTKVTKTISIRNRPAKLRSAVIYQ